MAFAVWRVRRLGATWRSVWSGLIVLVVFQLLVGADPTPPKGATEDRDAELSEVVAYLGKAHGQDWIVYAGHRGYELARVFERRHMPNFHHTLSFYPDQVLESTQGKRAYLLAPRPRGVGRWEDINLKYPGIFDRGAYFTVFERSWENWRLLRMVRMDESDRR